MRSKPHKILLFWTITGIFLLCFSPLRNSACELHQTVVDAAADEIRKFFDNEKKIVVTFVGYSGSEYEDKQTMLKQADAVLDEFEPSQTLVNIGATPEGIGAIYELAKRKGFMTTGIVSTQAKAYNAHLSDCVDFVFYVEDSTWGGFMGDESTLSPTSTAIVTNSNVVIGIGGGEVARDELIAARRLGKHVRFIPADMNHQKTREKAMKKGLQKQRNFGGAAGEYFNNK